MHASCANLSESPAPGARCGDDQQVRVAADARPRADGTANQHLSIDDCACLLTAVTARLRAAVDQAPTHVDCDACHTLQVMQGTVLECADALDQLRRLLRDAL